MNRSVVFWICFSVVVINFILFITSTYRTELAELREHYLLMLICGGVGAAVNYFLGHAKEPK